jgi:hypothetical protein
VCARNTCRADGGKDSESYTKTYNYELNEILTQIEEANGAIQDLSSLFHQQRIDGSTGIRIRSRIWCKRHRRGRQVYLRELMPFVQRGGSRALKTTSSRSEAVERLGRVSLIRTGIIAAAILLAVFMAIRLIPGRIAAAKAAAMRKRTGRPPRRARRSGRAAKTSRSAYFGN